MSRVINAAGHLSSLGGSVLSPAVREAMDRAATEYVDMKSMLAGAEAEIARLCGAEAACVTAGAAAGIAIAVAACITQGDAALVRQVPSPQTERREVAIQAGHLIDFGATVEQMVGLGGGVVRAAGTGLAVSEDDVERAIGPKTACFLWVQSHHTRGSASLDLASCLALAHARDVPFVIDCAAEEDLSAYAAMGADLVIYSGTKAIGAPVSGIITGREPYVGWCRAQSPGIARAMKVGKEQVAGLVAALREHVKRDAGAERRRRQAVLDKLEALLRSLPGAALSRLQDEAGRPIERLALRLPRERDARALAAALQAGDPAIFTRPHLLAEGLIQFDPRCLRDEDLAPILAALQREWPGLSSQP